MSPRLPPGSPPGLPNFDDLARLLADSPLAPSPAEVQGLWCGLVVGRVPDARGRWLAELLPAAGAVAGQAATAVEPPGTAPVDLRRAELAAALDALATRTETALADGAMALELLLPAEERSLRERADAVLEWIRGLLYGLGLAGLAPERLSPAGREALTDLLEITRLDLDALSGDEADELALAEVIEFLRVAVMLLVEESDA